MVLTVEEHVSTYRSELLMLPSQSCERCPGKSSHISPWVQMVEHPKYALHRGIKESKMNHLAIAMTLL